MNGGGQIEHRVRAAHRITGNQLGTFGDAARHKRESHPLPKCGAECRGGDVAAGTSLTGTLDKLCARKKLRALREITHPDQPRSVRLM